MEERTGWRRWNESQIVGEEKKNGRLVGASEISKERAEWRRLQQKNLNTLCLPKRKEWPQCHKESSCTFPFGKYLEVALAKRKRNRAVCPEYQIVREGRVKMSESCTLAREREGIRARAWGGKSGLHREGRQILRRTGRARKKILPRRGRRKHERVSKRKSSPGRSAESWFHSKSGQT